ncbi:EAL domain-containing protein [Enterobacter cloacae complex sp. 342H5]|nr:protein YcgG [Enterobacter hormaechei]
MVKGSCLSRFYARFSASSASYRVRMVISVAIALALMIAGLMVTGSHELKNERRDASAASKKLLSYTENLFDEANVAAKQGWLARDILCNDKKSRTLDILIARYPHIRGLNFVENGQVWCSSLTGNEIRQIPADLQSGERVGVLAGDVVTPDVPVLYYFVPVGHDEVLISINGLFIINAFRLAGVEMPTFIQIGNSRVTSTGEVLYSQKRQHYQYETVVSSRYPLRVSFERPTSLHWHKYWRNNVQLIIFFTLLSAVAGQLCWRALSRLSSPAQALRQAIADRHIVPYYQPVYDSLTHNIAGFEVLARWKQGDSGFISPDVFIPLAEQTRLIVPLTRMLMAQVTDDLRKVIGHFPPNIHIALNISAEHFVDHNLLSDVQSMLEAFHPHPVKIVLELTERQSIETTAEALANIEALKKIGVAIALDDFGTGYSNLAWIAQLNPDFIKIDKLFVGQIGQDKETALVDSVIEIARKMHLQLIAEGVETAEQVEYLRNKQIEFLQGYYFSRPIPANQFIRMVILKGYF